MLYVLLGGCALLYAIGKPRWILVLVVLMCLFDEFVL
jgi:hypothetical protein